MSGTLWKFGADREAVVPRLADRSVTDDVAELAIGHSDEDPKVRVFMRAHPISDVAHGRAGLRFESGQVVVGFVIYTRALGPES